MTMVFGNTSGSALADRRFGFAKDLGDRGDYAAAADILCQTVDMAPSWPPLHFYLGQNLMAAGDAEAAAEAFHRYIALDPGDHMGACLKLALMGAQDMPETMPHAYISGLFDEYAPRFETALVDILDYRIPEKIRKTLDDAFPGRIYPRLLDLGCGTGLAAQKLKGITKDRDGVDLSPAMVEIARSKNLYAGLKVESLETHLLTCPQDYDLITCADVFIYVGALGAVFAGVARAMSEDGLFIFSIQHWTSPDVKDKWMLGPDHRYAHTRTYINDCAAQSGLTCLTLTPTVIRKDAHDLIDGLLGLFEKQKRI